MVKLSNQSWREIRKKVLIRDNFLCRKCGASKKLSVHHVIPQKKTRDNSLDNLITLCSSCHLKMDLDFIKYGTTQYMQKEIKKNRRFID